MGLLRGGGSNGRGGLRRRGRCWGRVRASGGSDDFLGGGFADFAVAVVDAALRERVSATTRTGFSVEFVERYGLDRVALAGVEPRPGLRLVQHDIADGARLPFEDAFFDVVTMLAVFEHLETSTLSRLLLEIRRVLRSGGVYVMTTPTRWTEGLLRAMSSVRLVSHEEVGPPAGHLVAAVGAKGAREEIRAFLVQKGWLEGRDFTCAA